MQLLENPLRHYAWGSPSLIAEALGRPPSGQPEAELWLGSHPSDPSLIEGQGLDVWIAQDPQANLGGPCRAAFGDELPFLAKFLAAAAPLSLQVHPTAEQAAAGYAAEEAAGVPLTALERNYKDRHHKPEMILALTDFEALCGFRPLEHTRRIFTALKDAPAPVWAHAHALLAGPGGEEDVLRRLFEALLNMGDASEAVAQLQQAAATKLPLPAPLRESVTVASTISRLYPNDPGVLVTLMLHYARLCPGEALALPAGHIHAYLSGLGFEVMAASDNVLRGGLTSKHVDLPELMQVVTFQSLSLPRLQPEHTEPGQCVFRPEVTEFLLQRTHVEAGQQRELLQNGPLIVAMLEGRARLHSGGDVLTLERGQSAFVPAHQAPITVEGLGAATLVGVSTNLSARQ